MWKRAQRRPSSSRRGLARAGRAFQLLALVPVVVAVAVLVGALDSDGEADGVVVPPDPVAREAVTPASSAGGAVGGLPAGETSETTAAPAAGRRAENTRPQLAVPSALLVEGRGPHPVAGIVVADAEAGGGGEIGVLLAAVDARVFVDVATGARLDGRNGSSWLPLIGTVEALNATLATVRIELAPGVEEATLHVGASDFGHGGTYDELVTRTRIAVRRQ